MSRRACPCDSDGCPRHHAPELTPASSLHDPHPSDPTQAESDAAEEEMRIAMGIGFDPTPPDLFDVEPGESEAAVEETIAHLNAGEDAKWN